MSRYLLGSSRSRSTGADAPGRRPGCVNPTVGETGEPFPAAGLGPEHGFYVRRLQIAELRLPVPVAGAVIASSWLSAWRA